MVDDGENFFVGEELVLIFDELQPFYHVGVGEVVFDGSVVLRELGEIFVGVAAELRVGDRLGLNIGAEDDDHSGQLAFVLIEILPVGDDDANAFALYDAVGARGPGFRVSEQRDDVG